MNKRSRMANILLWSGLVLSAIAVLIGFGFLLLGIFILAEEIPGGYIDSYVWAYIGWSLFFGAVLLVPGILGLRACIKRLRGG
jgi:hypothetical protein